VRSGGQGTGPRGWQGRPPESWQAELGVPRLELHDELPSTSDRLRELSKGGAPAFTVVVAGAQSKGRGRMGRVWHSPPDSGLWLSILIRDGSDGFPALLPLAVGVAVARALERLVADSVALKWPNDILIGDRKVAGILCETVGDPGEGVIVGIGVNLRAPEGGLPHDLAAGVAFIEEVSGLPVAEPVVARLLLGELGRWVRPVPGRLEGRLLAEWNARDCLRGKPVILDDGIGGIASGVHPDGALGVILPDGREVDVRAGGVRLAGSGHSPALHGAAAPRFGTGGV